MGWQFSGSQALDDAYVPFPVAWDDAMVARWSANPLGMLWPEMDVATVPSDSNGAGEPPAKVRLVVVVLGGWCKPKAPEPASEANSVSSSRPPLGIAAT
jgi:hypothetical protein